MTIASGVSQRALDVHRHLRHAPAQGDADRAHARQALAPPSRISAAIARASSTVAGAASCRLNATSGSLAATSVAPAVGCMRGGPKSGRSRGPRARPAAHPLGEPGDARRGAAPPESGPACRRRRSARRRGTPAPPAPRRSGRPRRAPRRTPRPCRRSHRDRRSEPRRALPRADAARSCAASAGRPHHVDPLDRHRRALEQRVGELVLGGPASVNTDGGDRRRSGRRAGARSCAGVVCVPAPGRVPLRPAPRARRERFADRGDRRRSRPSDTFGTASRIGSVISHEAKLRHPAGVAQLVRAAES